MTQPKAIVCYENLLPGSQLVNRLQDLGYSVLAVTEPEGLLPAVERENPFIVVIDLFSVKSDLCAQISALKEKPETRHIPILAFTKGRKKKLRASAQAAGANLVAVDDAILSQLPQLLEQALLVE